MSHAKNIHVLIAEDDYLVNKMITGMVEELGFVVAGQAANGRQAVDLTCSLRPDVVLMDVKMPDMDGLQAAQHIQELCPTPVVVLTAYDTPELVARAGETGVGAYLTKPPNAQEIERAITIARVRFDDLMEMRRLNTELQARNADLDTFGHTVAHNLQSILGLITGYASLLQEEQLSEAGRDYVTAILRNGHKMSNIINELQLLAGVRQAPVELGPLNMEEIVTAAYHRLLYLVQEYQADIQLPSTPWPTAMGYAPWVEEIWVNYLSNGLKYGGRPPRLELGATECPDQSVRFWVRDNGPGLSPEEQARLFVPFTQLGQVRTGGYGLGLSIVRRIVERLHGQAAVESDGIPGKGCVFSFTLPAAPN